MRAVKQEQQQQTGEFQKQQLQDTLKKQESAT
jgi:hypothetical protein